MVHVESLSLRLLSLCSLLSLYNIATDWSPAGEHKHIGFKAGSWSHHYAHLPWVIGKYICVNSIFLQLKLMLLSALNT